jgi:DNA-binding NarL/FixJ family response regulator
MALKVAIAESNPGARSFLGRVVEAAFSDPLDLRTSATLEDALASIVNASGDPGDPSPVRLILVDLDLPASGALKLLDELAEHPSLKIATTLFADDEHLFPAIRRGACGYLLKEDRFEAQVESLQRMARGQWPLTPGLARRMMAHLWPAAPGPFADTPSSGRAALACLARGLSARETARHVGTSVGEVEAAVRSAYQLCQQSI